MDRMHRNGNLRLRIDFYEQVHGVWQELPSFPKVISKTIKVVLRITGKDSLVNILLEHPDKFRNNSSAIALHVDVNTVNNHEELIKFFKIVDVKELPNLLQYKHKGECSEFIFYLDYKPDINSEYYHTFAILFCDKIFCKYSFILAAK